MKNVIFGPLDDKFGGCSWTPPPQGCVSLKPFLCPGPDGIPVPNPSRTFFKYPTRRVPKIENDQAAGMKYY